MKTILLQAGGEGSPFPMLLMMAAVFGVMYFFMIRPQKKKEKELAKMRDAIKKGDDVITTGGIHGKVFETDAETVVIAIESQAKIRLEKSSIAVINGVGAGTAQKK